VKVVGHEGDWLQVVAGDDEGFLHSDFVRLEAAEDADPSHHTFFHADSGLAEFALPAADPVSDRANASARDKRLRSLWNRVGGLITELAGRMGIDPGLCTAVLRVESGGAGFRGSPPRMIIRFENHVFWRRFGKNNPDLFRQHYDFNEKKRWQGHRFRASPNDAWREFHGNQDAEWEVLTFARGMNEEAALRSISMGAPQVMGFNHGRVGFASALEMFEAFGRSEREQIFGLFDFIRGPDGSSQMVSALKRHDLERFATHYNGPGQAAEYATLIDHEFERFREVVG
jgi:hypothetical protein